MSTNYIQEGKRITFTAPSGGVVSGGAYLMGGLLVVAEGDADEGDNFVGNIEGVFELAKKTSDTMTVGAPIYWDNTNHWFTTTASAHYTQGTCIKAADSSADTVVTKLFGYGVVVNP